MSDVNQWAKRQSEYEFEQVRRQQMVASLVATLRRTPQDLISLEEVRARINVRGSRYLGHQVVEVARIVGSEGRYSDFDRNFLPRSDTMRGRWANIHRASVEQIDLPPIDLYKIDEVYFVRDGNHRVSVARRNGAGYIDGFVTELLVDVPLDARLDERALLLKEEYSDFLIWTDLKLLRPQQRIEFSELGGYLDLVKHINAHRYYMGNEQGRDISGAEAVADWYDRVYTPVVAAIRQHGALATFPGRTEGDLYRWIMDYRWYARERTGHELEPAAAAAEYARLFGRHSLFGALDHALREILAVGRGQKAP